MDVHSYPHNSGEVSEAPIRDDKEIVKLAGVSHDTIHKSEIILKARQSGKITRKDCGSGHPCAHTRNPL